MRALLGSSGPVGPVLMRACGSVRLLMVRRQSRLVEDVDYGDSDDGGED